MYGVILWSDPDVRKAVIWCEETGALAYYEAPDEPRSTAQAFFDPGDYVEFEMSEGRGPCRVVNAQAVMTEQSSRVNSTLRTGGDIHRFGASQAAGGVIEPAFGCSGQSYASARARSEINHRG